MSGLNHWWHHPPAW